MLQKFSTQLKNWVYSCSRHSTALAESEFPAMILVSISDNYIWSIYIEKREEIIFDKWN
jgi:hypothetical protein